MAGTKIPDQTAGAYTQVTDPTKLYVAVADRQSTAAGYGFAFSEIYGALTYTIEAAASHGLTSGDYGKPLSGFEILDDTDTSHHPSGVLVHVPNSNTLRVAGPGSVLTVSTALIEDGNAYDPSVTGRYVFWDLSSALYVSNLPVDCVAPDILEVITVGASTFTARVRSF